MRRYDANCWKIYVDEKIKVRNGIGVLMFEPTDGSTQILFDTGSLIRQQYIELHRPYAEQVFDSWFEGRVISGGVDLIEISGKPNIFSELMGLGIPKGEHIYFKVAVRGCADMIISLDSDFFDPKRKKDGEKEKRKLLLAGTGPVCKHMKKQHSITVCCPESALEM